MSDYQKDLDRFMSAWEQVQRDMLAQERLQELADLRGMTVEEVQEILDRIDTGLRRLHSPNRPTRAEHVDVALKHARQSGNSD
jgi:hypothetical protein